MQTKEGFYIDLDVLKTKSTDKEHCSIRTPYNTAKL